MTETMKVAPGAWSLAPGPTEAKVSRLAKRQAPSLARSQEPGARSRLFPSFFLGGFECSTHVHRSGRRLDLIAATAHDRFALADYQRLREQGIRAARDGIRWHLVERSPGHYDWQSVLPLVRAAQTTGVQVIWDLCHYGWPNDLDVFSTEFVRRFADLARAFVRWLGDETDAVPYVAPINEMSFLAWAGGAVALFPPFLCKRGRDLKRQLVRAAIATTEAVWEADPRARVFHIDPICNVVADPRKPRDVLMARRYHLSQYHVWDMICGRLRPELGGTKKHLDVVGVNYYIDNQWAYPGDLEGSTTIDHTHPGYRPAWQLLRDVYQRYRRPIFIAETGIEGDLRPGWLRTVCYEVRAALRAGMPIEGICLYPILNHPGWEDGRHCHNGLWDYADEAGEREIYAPLAQELLCQGRLFEGTMHEARSTNQAGLPQPELRASCSVLRAGGA
jgi:beta-glucosidase/6-phospho-beta-glucosidase/beta-galactosidase